MLRTKIISLFLLLVLTIQMLPIREIGSVLGSNQWTEELPHNSCDDGGKEDVLKFHSVLPPNQHEFAIHERERSAGKWVHLSASIPSNHSNDVVSPPPDAG